mmetsp:Transcript_41889/g.94623  ORF Transcript_41889/g.94623 Transcript_41889/m.94623 type:complete len:124 (+) Transcript_41889:583-954(+)
MLNVTVTKKTRRWNQGNILFTWSQPPSVHSLKEQALVDAPRSRGAAPLFDAYPAKKISPPSVCAQQHAIYSMDFVLLQVAGSDHDRSNQAEAVFLDAFEFISLKRRVVQEFPLLICSSWHFGI